MAKVYKHIAKPEHSVRAREVLGIGSDSRISPELLEEIVLVGGLTKKMNTIIGALIVEEDLWDMALDLAASDNNQTAFRVSWGLEWAYCMDSAQLEKRSGRFYEDFLNSHNESVQRVYSKMLCDMIRRDVFTIEHERAEQMAGKCFDLLLDSEIPVAVKVWQIELLTELFPYADWIEDSLTDTVKIMSESPDCTPAMAAHARHYFRKLNKRKKPSS